jgi:putative S-adenosyl-L-methionine-dependent methyltransferase
MASFERKRSPLETNQRLSQSLLWRLQRNYFERHGIEAWSSGAVPHHITSSPFIVDAYARVVLAFLRDCERSFIPLDHSQPIHIIELGSGSGRFAYLFLKKFLNLYRNSVLKEFPVKYVMTDFTESNLEYWRTHPWLRPFIKEGSLDFARFDLESDVQIELLHSGEILSSATPHNPLVVISNYVFDSTPQDAFLATDESLFEVQVSLTASQEKIDTADPDILSSVKISTHENPINGNYYEDPKWNRILLDYKQRLTDTAFLFPTSALQCIQNLHDLSRGRMMLLSGDRGYSRDEALQLGSGIPTFAVHGSISMMVDYQIIGEYCRHLGARVLHPPGLTEHLNISAFMFGDLRDDFIETRQAYAEAIEKFGPDDFFTLKEGVAQKIP